MEKIINISNLRTPIEVALEVDGEGKTTAKKLYAFLELDSSHYSRWCKSNITDNEFAEENVDYFHSPSMASEKGNFADDYKLTAHFAKKLSMKGTGERAEQAREYFASIEERAKQIETDRSNLSPGLQMFYMIADEQAKMELDQKRQQERIEKLEQRTDSIKEAVRPVLDNWREEINRKFNRIQKSADQPFNVLRTEMYGLLEARAGCDLGTRLRNKKQRMAESGCTKTEINNANRMDIIEGDKKLREIFSKIVSEYEIRYCA